ncbi:MAG: hypothetical protein ABI192_19335 [Bradyrhizobium sp.]
MLPFFAGVSRRIKAGTKPGAASIGGPPSARITNHLHPNKQETEMDKRELTIDELNEVAAG